VPERMMEITSAVLTALCMSSWFSPGSRPFSATSRALPKR